MTATMGQKQPRTFVTARNLAFVRRIVAGDSQAEAYRTVYNPNAKPQQAAEKGNDIAKRPHIAALIEKMRNKSEAKTLLTLNDRYAILAGIAQDPTARDMDKTAAIRVYNEMSGDNAPDRHEHTGPNGAPIPVAAEVTTRPMSKKERIASIIARRKQRQAAEEAAP